MKNEGANNDIYQQIQFGQSNIPSKKSYLNGNGYFSMIKLFDELDSQNQLLMNLRRNRWLVSEANLYLYVDQDFYVSQNVDPVERLYLFNYKNGLPIIDFTLDNSVNNNLKNRDKFIFGGFLEYDELDKPYRYKFRITNHINRILRKDSTNYPIALAPTNGINSISFKRAQTSDQEFINYPSTSILNPKGVVLHGSAGAEKGKNERNILEIFYIDY